MLVVPCPHCGPRNASDLAYKGEAVKRPRADSADAAQWRAYLYLRRNRAGWHTENWYCRNGCQKYFTVERNTVTNEFRDSPRQVAKS